MLRALRLLRDERGRRVDLVLTGFGQDDSSPITAMFSAARMAEEHRAVFHEAVQVYSPLAFLWRRWVTGYWHRARLEWRWRPHHGCSVAQWVKASRHWFEDPAT